MTAKQLDREVSQIVKTVRSNPHLSVTVSERPGDITLVNVAYDTDFSSYKADLLVKELITDYDFVIEYTDGGVEIFRTYEN